MTAPRAADALRTVILVLASMAPTAIDARTHAPGPDAVQTTGPSGSWNTITAPGNSPGTPNSHCAVYDAATNSMLVYYKSDVWSLSLGTNPQWTLIQPTGSKPPVRDGACAILDPVRHRLIVFGGYTGNNFSNETWFLPLDGTPVWSPLPVGGPLPAGRLYATAIYDPVRDRMLVYGGEAGDSFTDVWALSLAGSMAWSPLSPGGTLPSPRYGHVSIYDPTGDRMLVFGGWQGANPTADLWALSLGASPAWTALSPAGPGPSGRVYASAIFDAGSMRMVIHGGYSSGGLSDTWAVNLGAAPSWQALAPVGIVPNVRWIHTAVYESVLGRMVVFGGVGSADLRSLNWGVSAPVGSPVVQGFSPRFGRVGDHIVVLGTSLEGVTDVEFNGVPASILGTNYFYVNTQVPPGATSGLVSVTTPLGTAASTDTFTVGDAPVLSAAQPDSGKIDAPVTILGQHFIGTTRVAFHGIASTAFQVVSDSVLKTTVDVNASTGPIVVENPFGVTTSSWSFKVLPWEPRPALAGIRDAPNDQGGKLVIKWYASDYDATRIQTVTDYRVWRDERRSICLRSLGPLAFRSSGVRSRRLDRPPRA